MYVCRDSIGDDSSRMDMEVSPSRSGFAQDLCAAIRAGDTQLVTNIVTNVSPHAIVHYRDSSPHRRSFLHLACEMNACAIVKIFLSIGMPVDITDGRNRTCLHTAESAEMVTSLCENGAGCHRIDAAGYTPLHVYVCRGNAACVSAILQQHVCSSSSSMYVDALLPPSRSQWSALHIAASSGNAEIAQMLLTQSRGAVDVSRKVCMYVCTVCIWVCIYLQMYVYVYVCEYIHECLYTCMYA